MAKEPRKARVSRVPRSRPDAPLEHRDGESSLSLPPPPPPPGGKLPRGQSVPRVIGYDDAR